MMDPIPGYQCGPSNEETIFSPNFQHTDSQLRAINQINSVTADISEDAALTSATPDFNICSVLDFYLTENISSFHFNNLMGFSNDFSSSSSYQYPYQYDQWDISALFEADERSNNNIGNSSFGGGDEVADETCLYLQNGIGINGNLGGFGDLELIPADLPDLMEVDSCGKRKGYEKKTLVLDLDETLVHSTLTPTPSSDFTFSVHIDSTTHTVHVKKRPHLHAFLDAVSRTFQVAIFTASQSVYASKLLDVLDPDGTLISRRFYRDDCVFLREGEYVKDLRVLGVDLANVAIIDNLPQVYRLQEDNGIPIKSWYDDPTDEELIKLIPFLETLAEAQDVRPIISQKFGTNK
ncbi:hypothetical protein LUZ60_000650 [Juncus effusus]|nr:hypothetical protein LUZ60_000650 [Juncus effusus]